MPPRALKPTSAGISTAQSPDTPAGAFAASPTARSGRERTKRSSAPHSGSPPKPIKSLFAQNARFASCASSSPRSARRSPSASARDANHCAKLSPSSASRSAASAENADSAFVTAKLWPLPMSDCLRK